MCENQLEKLRKIRPAPILSIRLEKGENTVLIKICNTEFNWGLYLRITNNQGEPLKGLTYRL